MSGRNEYVGVAASHEGLPRLMDQILLARSFIPPKQRTIF